MRSFTRLCCALAVVTLPLALTIFPARGAAPANFTVDSLADTPDATFQDGLCLDANGACTLRAAIQQANANGTGDSIGFAVNGTINLTDALPILLTNMTINGPGASLLTVRRSTGGVYRILTVRAATVNISGLTVSNGEAPRGSSTGFTGFIGEPGGGIFNSGTLTLAGCVISGNVSGRGGGGASTFGDGGRGGGVYNEGELTMSGCTVSNNRTAAGFELDSGASAGGDGGGVYNNGELNMTNCIVADNSAPRATRDTGLRVDAKGSGIYAGGRTRITNSVVRDNRGGTGGGIYNSGNTTVESTTFSGNSTQDGLIKPFGPGIHGGAGGGIGNVGVLTLTNCTVSGNRTGNGSPAKSGWPAGDGGEGGGIASNGTLTLIRSTVSNNVTGFGSDAPPGTSDVAGRGGRGGGIASAGTLTAINCVVSRNLTGRGGSGDGLTTVDGDGGDGGGIANDPGSGPLKLSNSTVVFNETGEGGGHDGLGGGIYGGASLRSTIVALNRVRFPTSSTDVSGQGFVSHGYNYVGVSGGGCCFNTADRLDSGGGRGLDLKLDPNTLIPLPGSAAIDAGLAQDVDGQPVTTDRRGAARPFDDPTVAPAPGGDNSDIGAFERQSTDPPPAPATVQFIASTAHVTEGCVLITVTVTRTGPTDGTSVVSYVINDFTATQRGDFTYAAGRVTFAPGEDAKTIPVLISEDGYIERPEELNVSLTSATGGSLGAVNSIKVRIDDDDGDSAINPIDDAATFVCQHYHDFLGRQSDPEGQDFWTGPLASCGYDQGCRDAKRVDISAAFFLSIEFQQTGYFAIRVNKAAFGDRPGNPRYFPFIGETQELARGVVVGRPGFAALLEDNKRRYAEAFVAGADFQAAHGSQDAGQYVDSLFAGAGATPTQAERDAAVDAFGAGDNAGRAAALRSVVESGSVYNKLYNPAFVLMQYFAYLRRNPDAAPDNDFGGYDFWLAKLEQFTAPGEDARDERVALSRVRRAEMVRAFLLSAEYRGRFQGDPNRGS